jgi:hypothetical protein
VLLESRGGYTIIVRKFIRIFGIIAGISCDVEPNAICVNKDRRRQLGLSWLGEFRTARFSDKGSELGAL